VRNIVLCLHWLFERRPRRGRPHSSVQPRKLDIIQLPRHPVVAVGLPHLLELCDDHVLQQKWQRHSIPTDTIDGVVGHVRCLQLNGQRPGYCATTPGTSASSASLMPGSTLLTADHRSDSKSDTTACTAARCGMTSIRARRTRT